MHNTNQTTSATRRQFLSASTAGVAATLALPTIVTAKKTESGRPVVGSGEHTYELQHDWPQLPSKFNWQVTHNVAVDKSGNLYVIHEGDAKQKDHPSIFVFDPHGKFIRAFGAQFQGGGHGIEVREEGSEEFLYIAAYQQVKAIAKLTLTGDTIWYRRAPIESGRYAKGEATHINKTWGRDRFMPTNFAFLNESEGGGFFLADGYGAHCIHRYDDDGNWQSTFGKPGKADGEFNLPHGLWIDRRGEGAAKVAVADRANSRLQWFTLDGKHVKTQDGYLLPANIDTHGDVMLVPDLKARVTLLDKNDEVIVHLGDNSEWREKVLADGMKLRRTPDDWVAGKFLHPHDACFDAEGNIFLAEWVSTGRITKLRRVGA